MSSIEVIHVRRQPAHLPSAARRRRSSDGSPPEEVLVHTGVPLPSQDPRPTRSRPERGATVAPLASDFLFILQFRFHWSRGHWPWNREYHTATLSCLLLCTYHPCRPSTAVLPAPFRLGSRLLVPPSRCVPQWYASPNWFVRCHVQQVEPWLPCPVRALALCRPTLMCLACQPI